MSVGSNNVTSEIDQIIARAMAEYASVRGIDVFSTEELRVDANTPAVVEEQEDPIVEVLPSNSDSILIEETTSRFSSAIWYNNVQSKIVMLAGLGGIGSYVAFLLGRIHVDQLYLMDDDFVETANMSGQLYGRSHVGTNKATATGTILGDFADYYSYMAIGERFTRESTPTNIMICGFDNMEARKIYYEAWKSRVLSYNDISDRATCLFIDGRLAAEEFQVFCIKGDDEYNMSLYESKYLFRDDQAEETICSYKQTSFIANMIGSIIVNLFVNFCANECDPLVPRDLPFLTEYNAERMFFKVTN